LRAADVAGADFADGGSRLTRDNFARACSEGAGLLDPSLVSFDGVIDAPSRVIEVPAASAGRDAVAVDPMPAPGGRVAVGLAGSALAVLRGDSSAESGQQMIPRSRARTKPVNPNHRMSPASLGRLAPMIGAAMVAIISPHAIFPAGERRRVR